MLEAGGTAHVANACETITEAGSVAANLWREQDWKTDERSKDLILRRNVGGIFLEGRRWIVAEILQQSHP